MTEIENKIITLLKQGYTYNEIQDALQVSSKTIAAVKKEFLSVLESNSSKLSDDAFRTFSDLGECTFQPKNKTNKSVQTTKRNTHMGSEKDYLEDSEETSKLEVEKYRLELAHVLELERIQAARDEKGREFDLKEKELEIRRLELMMASKKVEEEQRSLLFRIKKLVESCLDGEYSYDEADEMLHDARKVLSESEQFCHIYNITFENTTTHIILQKLISILENLLEDLDENDSDELEFEGSFTRLITRMNFTSF